MSIKDPPGWNTVVGSAPVVRTRNWVDRVVAEAKRSRIAQMAAALSYRTIFALIPVLAVATVVIRSFVTKEDLGKVLAKALEYAGLTEIVVEKEQVGPDPAVAEMARAAAEKGAAAAGDLTGSIRLDEWIERTLNQTGGVSFTAVGIVAVITLIYAAISMLVEVERAFNEVYKAPAGRSWPRRITLYWTLLTLGAIGLFGSVYLGEQFRVWATRAAEGGFNFIGVGTPVKAIGFAITAMISTLLLLLMYTTVPTARVRFWPALGGAALGAVLWEGSKWGFAQYLHYSASYAKLYGAIAVVPLFLLWVYLTWGVMLVGLQVAYVLQYGLADDEPHGTARVVDPTAGIAIIGAIAQGFSEGKTIQAPQAARWSGIGLEAAESILSKLVGRGLVHTVRREEGGPEGFSLARPPEKILVREVLEAAYEATEAPSAGTVPGAEDAAAGARFARELRQGQLDQAGQTTVAAFLSRTSPVSVEPTLPPLPTATWQAAQAGASLSAARDSTAVEGAAINGPKRSETERSIGGDAVTGGGDVGVDDDLSRLLPARGRGPRPGG